MKEVTIYDIAKTLGISASSVSRAISDNGKVSRETRKKVLAVAEEMGYRVNNFARNLRKDNNNKLIGVIFHKLNSQFSINALYSIEKVVRKAGYDIIICHSAESREQEIINAENLFQRRVDGLIVGLAADVEDVDHFNKYIDNGIPVLFFDRVKADFPAVKIVLDNFNAAYMATSHLIEQGCSRIVHIAGKQNSSVYVERLKGYKKALEAHDIKYDHKLVLQRGVDAEAAPLLAADILAMRPRPDAVFSVNDLCAAICMKTLIKAGVKVPEEIAFASFNNDPISTIIEPNLTTINYTGVEIGEIVAKNIINGIQHKQDIKSNYSIQLKPELIIRESSLKK
jgi:LacI family transcriptional regulator